MLRLSANLGFLWNDRPLPQAIRAAAQAGFDAVECHWPYEEDAGAVRAALAETGLPMLALNTVRGRAGEAGLAALRGREREARAAIDQAFDYAEAIGAGAVHVMMGAAEWNQESLAVASGNLAHACDRAAAMPGAGTVLIEPLNTRDAPGYFLVTLEAAAQIVERVARPELKVMFDCYHQQIMGGDLVRRFERHRAIIGHVQIAAVPSRAEPDEGEIAFDRLLRSLEAVGYDGFVGAEYRPRGAGVEAGLGWLATLRTA